MVRRKGTAIAQCSQRSVALNRRTETALLEVGIHVVAALLPVTGLLARRHAYPVHPLGALVAEHERHHQPHPASPSLAQRAAPEPGGEQALWPPRLPPAPSA